MTMVPGSRGRRVTASEELGGVQFEGKGLRGTRHLAEADRARLEVVAAVRISEVLPALGETGVRQSTLDEPPGPSHTRV
ncbi:hypothetical protein V1460_27675 [Streptomyces sp. SCSIO 30461]|uniref:hypothetical protein n=1 Tax=Streptomyces sp. SCSIO 30461 TaxID=3118085 RepID=UPI0030D31401